LYLLNQAIVYTVMGRTDIRPDSPICLDLEVIRMKRVRYLLIVLGVLLSSVTSAAVQVGIGIGLPHVSIGINFPAYPELVVVPGYPVYYAPRLQANLFFYDGLYWVYQDDYWYASSWYNGPWWIVEPEFVPVFILRVPVRYYRRPPAYFIGWRGDAPPRWGDRWGHDWSQHRRGWDRWDRRSAPQPAPPPVYQKQYSGDRYPRQVEQQYEIHQQNYHYQPRDPVVQQQYQEQAAPPQGSIQQERQRIPRQNSNPQQGDDVRAPSQANVPNSGAYINRDEDVQRSAPPMPQQGRPEIQDQRTRPRVDQRDQQDGVDVYRPEQGATQERQPQRQYRRQQPQQETGQDGNNTTNEPRGRRGREWSGDNNRGGDSMRDHRGGGGNEYH